MRITIDGSQFAEAIQQAEWVLSDLDTNKVANLLGAELDKMANAARELADKLRYVLIDCPPRQGMSNIAHREWLQGLV